MTTRNWGLPDAQRIAAVILEHPQQAKQLIHALLTGNEEIRKRAADVARRITEKKVDILASYAEEIIGAFSESISINDNWRTRAHLGLVAARLANTRQQRLRTAGLLRPLLNDPGNVVRCTALEGLGILSESEPTLQTEVTLVLEEALQTGTLAMKNRAQHALKKMANRSSFTVKKRKETMRSK